MQIDYDSEEEHKSENMISWGEKELGCNSCSDEWLGRMNRVVLIKANI